MSRVITIRKIKALKAKSNANAKAKASRSRRGDFNILWLIVAIVGVVIGVIIFYFIYAGGTKSLSGTIAPAIQAQAMNGILTVNIKDTGVGSITIQSITLYSGTNTVSGCTPSSYYLDGNSLHAPPVTINPGDTYTVVYSGTGCSTVTNVEVVTSAGTYTAAVS